VWVRFGRCDFDRDRWELRRDGVTVALEPRAMQILSQLLDRRGELVTKTDLLDNVWGDRFVSEAALTTQIKELRRAVGDTGREQSIIKTVHGHGYRFIADVHEDVAAGDGKPAAGNGDSDHRVEPPNLTDRPVVAVLPFENLSPAESLAHVAIGLTSDVVTALSKHRWLRVVPRTTASGYAGRPDAVTQLRADLGVDYVVDGTVRVGGDRLRVTVSLTDATSGTCWWAERYDRRFEDLFDVLDDITDVVVATIEPEVGSAERERVVRLPRTDLRAWDLYHLGVAHFFRFTADDNVEAQRLLDEARRIDPDLAEAHAWWAYAVVLGMTYWDTDPDPDTLDRALAATSTAVGSDDHNALFHMLRGRVQIARRDYTSALTESRRAVDLNPALASAFCGLGDSLCYEGRYDEALDQFTRAVELGSHDPQRWAFLSYGAVALLFSGRFEEAIQWSERAAAIPNCQYWATAHQVVGLAHLGRSVEASAAVTELLSVCPRFTIAYARRKLFFLRRSDQIDLYLDGLRSAGVPEE
jgi:TolB-like protein